MNEETKISEVTINLPKDAIKWLERALQWLEDIPSYDRLNKPINGSEIGMPL
jgi:hypothetical protein